MPNTPPVPETCPYLGLHDDSATSLAYPSHWNYCYRARPPASVSISHQDAACLSRKHVDCPVYLAERERALPSDLRGSSTVPVRHAGRQTGKLRRAVWIILLAALLLLTVWWFWGRQFFPLPVRPIPTPSLAAVSTELPLPTAPVNAVWTNPALFIPSLARTSTPRASQTSAGTVSPSSTPTETRIPSRTPTKTITPTSPATLPPGTCGHSLETQFGTNIKFVIHRVVTGDNMDIFISKYQTSLDAILAVNFSLHVPLWADSIMVIPVGLTDTRGVPAFEPYQASGETISLEALAQRLNTDAQSLRKYNAFDDSCKTFINWLLIPRARP
jgi:hypothetical protein